MQRISHFISIGLALTLVIASTLLIFVPAGHAQTVGQLTISNHWLRASPPAAKVAAGFLKITNNGSEDDTLVAVEFSGATKSELHQMVMIEGVMKMRPINGGIPIPAGGTSILKPGGNHLMFFGLKSQLKEGQNLSVNLQFANAGAITLDFPVMAKDKGKMMMHHGD